MVKLFLLHFLLASAHLSVGSSALHDSVYHNGTRCSIAAYETKQVSSRAECACTCTSQMNCTEFSYRDRICEMFSSFQVCSPNMPNITAYKKAGRSKPPTPDFVTSTTSTITTTPVVEQAATTKGVKRANCQHDGAWDDAAGRCNCKNGFAGAVCERYPYGCYELPLYGYAQGMHLINVDIYKDNSLLIYTQCMLSGTSTRTLIFVNDGNYKQRKPWADVVKGYSFGEASFWLGLQNVWMFNQKGYGNVVFSVVLSSPNNLRHEWLLDYHNFTIKDAQSSYAINSDRGVARTEGSYFLTNSYTLGDILGQSQGAPFSTWDSDNDLDKGNNCAAMAEAGWWFNDCSQGIQFNLLGVKSWFYPRDNQMVTLQLPGLDMKDFQVQQTFQYVLMYFDQ